jgi:hypothetical protein
MKRNSVVRCLLNEQHGAFVHRPFKWNILCNGVYRNVMQKSCLRNQDSFFYSVDATLFICNQIHVVYNKWLHVSAFLSNQSSHSTTIKEYKGRKHHYFNYSVVG